MSSVRRLVPLLAVLCVVALPLVARAAATHEVTVADNSYTPAQLQIEAGDTVRWTNRGLRTHTVTFSGEPREDLLPTRTRQTTFTTPGTYRYRCEYHSETMQGSLVVRAASASTTSTTRAATTSTTQDARGSAITAPPDTSTTTTTTSSTTTTVVEDTTTTTTSTMPGDDSALGDPGDDEGDLDGPGAVAALLLLATAGGTFTVARRTLP